MKGSPKRGLINHLVQTQLQRIWHSGIKTWVCLTEAEERWIKVCTSALQTLPTIRQPKKNCLKKNVEAHTLNILGHEQLLFSVLLQLWALDCGCALLLSFSGEQLFGISALSSLVQRCASFLSQPCKKCRGVTKCQWQKLNAAWSSWGTLAHYTEKYWLQMQKTTTVQ